MQQNTKGVAAFLLLAFGIAWLFWLAAWISGTPPGAIRFQFAVLPGAFAPAIAALIVRSLVTREGYGDAGLGLHLRYWRYYLFALLYPWFVVGAILALNALFRFSEPDFSLQRALAVLAPGTEGRPLSLNLLPVLVLGPLLYTPLLWGEEFGWRGYLQLRLSTGKPVLAALATGLIWSIWHWPLVLLGYERYENPVLGLAVFTGFTILLSIIFGWLRLRTGSIWSTALAHASTNSVGVSLTRLVFLGGPNWTLVGFNGVLAWIPLGAICLWILTQNKLTSMLAREPGHTAA